MSIDEIYSQVKFLLRKNQQGSIRPSQFNSIWRASERAVFNEYLGRPQGYDKNSSSQTAYAKTERIADSLLPFVKYNVALTQLDDGSAVLPPDYYYIDILSPVTYPNKIKKVKYIEHYQINDVLASTIAGPDDTHIYYAEYPGKVQIWPTCAVPLNLTYLSEPKYGVWAYTMNAVTGQPAYDPIKSIDPEWYDLDVNHIIDVAIGMFSLAMRDQMGEQYSNLKLKTGD